MKTTLSSFLWDVLMQAVDMQRFYRDKGWAVPCHRWLVQEAERGMDVLRAIE